MMLMDTVQLEMFYDSVIYTHTHKNNTHMLLLYQTTAIKGNLKVVLL